MPRSLYLFLVLLAGLNITHTQALATTEAPEIEKLLASPQVQLGGQTITTNELKSFYAPRAFQPLWTANSASDVLNTLKHTAEDHGLNPDAYGVSEDLTDAPHELLVSASLTRLGHDLATGRIPPYRLVGGIGEGTRPHFDGVSLLKSIAQGSNPADLLTQLTPQTPNYLGLSAGLKSFRSIAKTGGWPTISDGPPVKPDESDARIPTLRARLIVSGDLSSTETASTILDAELVIALKRFQIRHGLEPDGAIGKRTLAALNVPVATRIRQIEVSMERLRQLPRQREADRIDVNIASQTLILYTNQAPVLEMRVVTGDVKHQTPTMATRVAALTVNPTWTVPASIARKEILPKLKRDPNYLAHNNLHILDAFPENSPEAEGSSVDWTKMGKSFPYVLRQVPGPDNALGQLKFNLQNQDAIYMHDTPQKAFFKRSYRLLSHGCIRLEHPLDLADQLLGAEWHEKLPPLIAEGKTRTLILKHSLPVYLMYQTAWAEPDGGIAFRDDSYGNDQRLDQAIGQSATFTPKDGGQENL